jgi:hypothetical protein
VDARAAVPAAVQFARCRTGRRATRSTREEQRQAPSVEPALSTDALRTPVKASARRDHLGPEAAAGWPTLGSLAELEELVRSRETSYVRYSEGPDVDAHEQSVDTESGLKLPGLSVNPLHPAGWWTRPLPDWLARQVCQYQDLHHKNPARFPWVLDGRVVERGPDNEPLLVDVEILGTLSQDLLEEAGERYNRNFRAGKGPED